MGVNGLQKFVQKEQFSNTEKYSNCTILVDASGLMYSLLNILSPNYYCGGNYKQFKDNVLKCFQKLKQCQIISIVVLDGATPIIKHSSKFSRLEKSLESYRSNNIGQSLWNHLIIDVFVETLKELNITVIQSPYEADDVLAFLSYRFKLPILTNDSDFYFFRHPVLSIHDLINTEIISDNGNSHLVLRTIDPNDIRMRFNIENEAYFSIAPILIGNDFIPPLQDYLSNWKFSRKFNSPLRDRNSNIISILKWVSSFNTKDFDNFNLKLHEIINPKFSTVAIKFIERMNELNHIYLYEFPKGTDPLNFFFTKEFQPWFHRSMEYFYSQKFPYLLLSRFHDRELNIILTKTDWHRAIPENFDMIEESSFEICGNLAEIIYSCLLDDDEEVNLVHARVCSFNMLEMSNTKKIVKASKKNFDESFPEDEAIRKLMFMFGLHPDHLSYFETLLKDKPDQLLAICFVLLRRQTKTLKEFNQALLICLFLPFLSSSPEDEIFYLTWCKNVEDFSEDIWDKNVLHLYNQFQIVLSSVICLTRILSLNSWNPSQRLSRLDGEFLTKIFALSKNASSRFLIDSILERFPSLKKIENFILSCE